MSITQLDQIVLNGVELRPFVWVPEVIAGRGGAVDAEPPEVRKLIDRRATSEPVIDHRVAGFAVEVEQCSAPGHRGDNVEAFSCEPRAETAARTQARPIVARVLVNCNAWLASKGGDKDARANNDQRQAQNDSEQPRHATGATQVDGPGKSPDLLGHPNAGVTLAEVNRKPLRSGPVVWIPPLRLIDRLLILMLTAPMLFPLANERIAVHWPRPRRRPSKSQ